MPHWSDLLSWLKYPSSPAKAISVYELCWPTVERKETQENLGKFCNPGSSIANAQDHDSRNIPDSEKVLREDSGRLLRFDINHAKFNFDRKKSSVSIVPPSMYSPSHYSFMLTFSPIQKAILEPDYYVMDFSPSAVLISSIWSKRRPSISLSRLQNNNGRPCPVCKESKT